MKTLKIVALVPVLAGLFSAATAAAQEAGAPSGDADGASVQPIGVSLFHPVQTGSERASIHGMRLNLVYGVNRDVRGFDLGIANHSTRDSYGVAFGLGGYTERDLYGVQGNFVLSIVERNAFGLQQGIYNSAGSLWGVQAGPVNRVEDRSFGARLGLVNLAGDYAEGAEFGVVNHGREVRGLQLGIVNVADELHGVQIGVANIAKNGFLPFFPVVNAAL